MKKVRHSRVRMFQATEGGKEESFGIRLDDMFLFPQPDARSPHGRCSTACGVSMAYRVELTKNAGQERSKVGCDSGVVTQRSLHRQTSHNRKDKLDNCRRRA